MVIWLNFTKVYVVDTHYSCLMATDAREWLSDTPEACMFDVTDA